MMEPVIRNVRHVVGGPVSARLVKVDDNAPTCTMTYSEIPPDGASSHHNHVWEHEVYIIEGSGTLFCDGNEYPIKAGDALFIPPNADHYTLNNGGRGNIKRIEVNPVDRSGIPQTRGAQPPVVRNHSELNQAAGHVLISSKDGAPHYVMLHNDPMPPGAVSHADTGGHTHEWEHVVFMLEGPATFVCDGKNYTLTPWDGMLVPPNVHHQWKNESQTPVVRVTFNPVASESAEH